MALAQAVVPGYDKPVTQEEPSVYGGARNAPAGIKSKPATVAQPPDATESSGTLGAPNAERRER